MSFFKTTVDGILKNFLATANKLDSLAISLEDDRQVYNEEACEAARKAGQCAKEANRATNVAKKIKDLLDV